MAKELSFSLAGAEYAATPVKLERKKIYGWSDLVATDNSGEVCDTALRMAQVISEQLDGCKGMDRNDVKDFATPAFGFVEKEEV